MLYPTEKVDLKSLADTERKTFLQPPEHECGFKCWWESNRALCLNNNDTFRIRPKHYWGWVGGLQGVCPSHLPGYLQHGHQQKYLKHFWPSFCRQVVTDLYEKCKSSHLKTFQKGLPLSNRLNSLHPYLECVQSCCQWHQIHVLPLLNAGC